MKPVTFRISSGLKSIIGRELITDDFIAVFELVKNSFDAGAKRVDITFDDLGSESARLTIRDDGKGMGRADISKQMAIRSLFRKERRNRRLPGPHPDRQILRWRKRHRPLLVRQTWEPT